MESQPQNPEFSKSCDKEDEKYWERMQKLKKQGDRLLMAYLGVDLEVALYDRVPTSSGNH